MFGIGAPELVLILVVALIFIGPQKLPEVARTFGNNYRQFQRAFEREKAEFEQNQTDLKPTVGLSTQDASGDWSPPMGGQKETGKTAN